MLWSRPLLMLLLSLSFPVWAGDGPRSPELNARLCELLLGKTLVSAEPPRFDLGAGFGMRGFLGAFPEATAAASTQLAPFGIGFWGQSFKVVKSLEEARAHDAQFSGLSKITYLISDVEVSDLKDDSPDDTIQSRFREVFATARFVYWDDSEAILKKDPSIPPSFHEVDKASVAHLIVPETIEYFTEDERGPRFTQSGWVFPRIHGELNYEHVFNPNAEPVPGRPTIAGLVKDLEKNIRKGFTITFNQNFQESLDAARDQIRIEWDPVAQKLVKRLNSRYLKHPEEYRNAQEGHAAGITFSVEYREPDGKLIAGVLGDRHGNLIKLETIFYRVEDKPDGGFKSHIHMAKHAVLATLKRMHEKGILVADGGMVTDFTASLRGEYASSEDFARNVEKLNAMPTVDLDFERPWTP